MYKVECLPAITSCDLFDAIDKRFGRKDITLSDLFEAEVPDYGFYPYWLNRDNEISGMPPKEAMAYMMVKQTLNKDFRIATNLVLIDVS